MTQPNFDTPNVYIRRYGEMVLFTTFTLYRDWSCGFLLTGSYTDDDDALVHRRYEFNKDGWRNALARLSEHGYVALEEARTCHLVPADWLPPQNPNGCGRVAVTSAEQSVAPDCGSIT
jgi:hypothetical protein